LYDTGGPKTVSESIVTDKYGRIFLTDFEHSSIAIIETNNAWNLKNLIQDEILRWPYGISIANGYLYVTCSAFNHLIDDNVTGHEPFHIVKINIQAIDSTNTIKEL